MHTVTCDECRTQQTMRGRAYPRRWQTDKYDDKGYYMFLCPDCKPHGEPAREGVLLER